MQDAHSYAGHAAAANDPQNTAHKRARTDGGAATELGQASTVAEDLMEGNEGAAASSAEHDIVTDITHNKRAIMSDLKHFF